jgi:hypothetical protein
MRIAAVHADGRAGSSLLDLVARAGVLLNDGLFEPGIKAGPKAVSDLLQLGFKGLPLRAPG